VPDVPGVVYQREVLPTMTLITTRTVVRKVSSSIITLCKDLRAGSIPSKRVAAEGAKYYYSG
jgi:hypothetical protein